MDSKQIVHIAIVVMFIGTASGTTFHHYSPNSERITDFQEFAKNLTENSAPLQMLEHTITPYDMNPEQLKLIGRYVFLAPQENNLYFVGFERTINKSDEAKKIINDLISQNLVTSVYKVQRVQGLRLEKFITIG